MESENTPISEKKKPEKYLVLSRRDVIAMYNQIIQEQIQGGYGSVVLRVQHASKRVPGQLELTDECRSKQYDYWPMDGDEVFNVEGAV